MGLKSTLARLAAGAPTPVFAASGLGAGAQVQDLGLHHQLRFVDTPSAASILLVAGGIPDTLAQSLFRLHDTMPHPRCTAWWPLGASAGLWLANFPHHVAIESNIPERLGAVHGELVYGQRPSEPPILADEDPAPWRGIGPYGQGGTGMTGGTPYGRPMAELGPDRDGLRLDVLPLNIGPFFPRFPAGLTLELKLAGDVIVEAGIPVNPFRDSGQRNLRGDDISPFTRALSEPVLVSELELARARAHLRWLANALVACELRSLGLRVLRLATTLGPGESDPLHSLQRVLGWTQALGWSTKGVGRVGADKLVGLGLGPIARASGLAEDVRAEDEVYRDLGFEPIVQTGGDAAARWRQRLAEASQSLALAARAGDRLTAPGGVVESPHGRLERTTSPADRLLPLLPGLLQDMEWGDAVTTLVSLDLDLEEATTVEIVGAEAVTR